MAFKLQSNPLENNALFAAPEAEPPKKQDKPKKSGKTAAQPKPEADPVVEQDPEEYIRATFIVRQDLLRRLKDYAYTDRREIKAVINEILEQALDEIEAGYAKRGEKMLHMNERGLPASGSRR